jgi:hypothetical protein
LRFSQFQVDHLQASTRDVQSPFLTRPWLDVNPNI